MRKKSINDLSTDEQVLFHFIALIIDIKYRHRYGASLEPRDGAGYSKYMKDENLPAQIVSVESGLEGTTRRRLSDGT